MSTSSARTIVAVDQTKLELGIGKDEASARRMSRCLIEDLERKVTQSIGVIGAYGRMTSSKEMFSSWPPVLIFAAGVKIGSGRRSDSRSPAGSLIPQMEPVAW